MNRRTLFGRFAELQSANRTANRQDYFRLALEPLEDRKMLTALSHAWVDNDDNFDGTDIGLGDQVHALFFDAGSATYIQVTANYGFTAFGDVTNATDPSNPSNHFLAGDENIHDGIAATASGGILQIADGTYSGSDILLNAPITVFGHGASTIIVPEVVADHSETTNFGKAGAGSAGGHQGFIINAHNVTVSNLTIDGNGGIGGAFAGTSMNYQQGVTSLYDITQDGNNFYSAYDYTNPGTPIHVPLVINTLNDGTVTDATKTVNWNADNLTVNNTFVHGIALAGSFNTTRTYFTVNIVSNQINNVGPTADRATDLNRDGILLMNTDDSLIGSNTLTGVGVGIMTTFYGTTGQFGNVAAPSSHGNIGLNVVTDAVQRAYSKTLTHSNNGGDEGLFEANTATWSNPANTAVGLYWDHSESGVYDDTIVGAKIGIQVTNTTFDIQGTGRSVAPVMGAGTIIVGPGGSMNVNPLLPPNAPGTIVAGSIGIMMDNTVAEPGPVSAEVGEVRVYGFGTGIDVAQSPVQSEPSQLLLDRARIAGNTVGINAGNNSKILGGSPNITDPINLSGSATINPSYSNPLPIVTDSPALVTVEGDQLASPVAVPPTADIVRSGNLTLSSTATYAPFLTGQSATVTQAQLFDFNTALKDEFGTPFPGGVFPDQAADTPTSVGHADNTFGPPYETDTGEGSYLGFWHNDATQDGTGQLVIAGSAVNGSAAAFLFGEKGHPDPNNPGFVIADPVDLSTSTSLNIVVKALSDNQSPTFGVGLIDERGNVEVYQFDSIAMSTSTFTTLSVNLLAASNHLTGPDNTTDLKHIAGWVIAADNGTLTARTTTPFRYSFDGFSTSSIANSEIDVHSTITLGGTLSPTLAAGFAPSIGSSFILIKNNSGTAVSGSFSNAPDGGLLTIGGNSYQVSYQGNGEHDVTLTRVANDAPPVINPPTGYTNSWSTVGTPVSVVNSSTATVTDADDGTLASMTVSIASPAAHDVLNASNSGSVTVSGNGTNTLVFTGGAVGDYQAALRTATYNNTTGDEGVGPKTINITAVDPHGVSGSATTQINIVATSTVTNRFLFYKGSSRFDVAGGVNGRPASIPFSDDNAIASDKVALLPGGGAATQANYSSYDQGINGIMVDLLGGGTHSAITASDFTIKVGNNNSPSLWAAGPTLTTTVRLGMTGAADGAGTVSGSDRVELMWANGAITEKWVEVIVKADANTGLAANSVFYFGNEIGDSGSGNSATVATVTSADVTDAQTHGASIKANIPTSNLYDFNKDGQVASADVSDAQTHGTSVKTGLILISIAGGGPFAPDAGTTTTTDSGVASALAGTSSTSAGPAIPAWVANRLSQLDLNSGPIASYLEHLADEGTPRAKAILVVADKIADRLGLDDTLLDSLLVDLGLPDSDA